MMPLRYQIAEWLYSAAEALDSPHSRAVRAARDRELLRRALVREAYRDYGDECERGQHEASLLSRKIAADIERQSAVTPFVRKRDRQSAK